jgi:hypothetical protein
MKLFMPKPMTIVQEIFPVLPGNLHEQLLYDRETLAGTKFPGSTETYTEISSCIKNNFGTLYRIQSLKYKNIGYRT